MTVNNALRRVDRPWLNLPDRGALNENGSVTYTLRTPVRTTPRGEPVTVLTAWPLSGLQVRTVLDANEANINIAAFKASLRMPDRRVRLIGAEMHEADVYGMSDVIHQLIGLVRNGLPRRAVDDGECIGLDFLRPVKDAERRIVERLSFRGRATSKAAVDSAFAQNARLGNRAVRRNFGSERNGTV